MDGITAERELLRQLRENADLVVDTSTVTGRCCGKRSTAFGPGRPGTGHSAARLQSGPSRTASSSRAVLPTVLDPELREHNAARTSCAIVLSRRGGRSSSTAKGTAPADRAGRREGSVPHGVGGVYGGTHRSVAISEEWRGGCLHGGRGGQRRHAKWGGSACVANSPQTLATNMRDVAFGGGHGRHATLSALWARRPRSARRTRSARRSVCRPRSERPAPRSSTDGYPPSSRWPTTAARPAGVASWGSPPGDLRRRWRPMARGHRWVDGACVALGRAAPHRFAVPVAGRDAVGKHVWPV